MLLSGYFCLLFWCFLALAAAVYSSSIPMWEFLSKEEKMSHLFNTFAKQVTQYCGISNIPDCDKALLVHGLSNLAKMNEEALDNLDPYQRGASDMIWDKMMKGSIQMMAKKPEVKKYADALDLNADETYLGSASNNVEEIGFDAKKYHNRDHSMVFRVYPDGRPVPSDQQNPLPKDEDAEERIYMRSKPISSMAARRRY